MHFGEYELFPSLIGLSPLPTGHPKTFQRQLVRSSTVCYHSFNLPMGRSLGFASTTTNLTALFRLAFASAPNLKFLTLLVTVTRRLIMQKARRHHEWLRPLVGVRFQVLFHSLTQGSFHLSLTVLVHYRSFRSIQPQRMVPPDSYRITRVPHYSGYYYLIFDYLYETITLFGQSFQTILVLLNSNIVVLQPQHCRNNIGLGYSAFARHYQRNHFCFLLLRVLRCFSSPGLLTLRCDISSIYRVAPFGNLRIIMYVPLPVTYRSLSRPSSPLKAQASSIRPYLAYCTFCFRC